MAKEQPNDLTEQLTDTPKQLLNKLKQCSLFRKLL